MNFDRTLLKDGMILHGRNNKPGLTYGRIIRSLLHSWGNHDALLTLWQGQWCVCDVLAGERSRYTPLTEYEEKIDQGKYSVRIYDPIEVTEDQRRDAVEYWHDHILGTVYDYRGILNILIKWAFPVWKIRQWEWAHWCTESCHESYLAADVDLWRKDNPTPRTTENRKAGPVKTLSDITLTLMR